MPPATVSYHYRVAFPRVFDAPRPTWPITIYQRVRALPDVVEALFPDLTATWHDGTRDDVGGALTRRESRRRFIEVTTSSATPKAAEAARIAVLALLEQVRRELELDGPLLVTRHAVDVYKIGPAG